MAVARTEGKTEIHLPQGMLETSCKMRIPQHEMYTDGKTSNANRGLFQKYVDENISPCSTQKLTLHSPSGSLLLSKQMLDKQAKPEQWTEFI